LSFVVVALFNLLPVHATLRFAAGLTDWYHWLVPVIIPIFSLFQIMETFQLKLSNRRTEFYGDVSKCVGDAVSLLSVAEMDSSYLMVSYGDRLQTNLFRFL
jgi:hypothetical protein